MSNRWRRLRRPARGAALVAVLGATLAGSACGKQPPGQPSRPILRVATAFGPLSEPLTAEYRRTLPDIDVQSVRAPSSPDVIQALKNGTADLGVAFTNDTYEGYWTPSSPNTSTTGEIRGVALLQPLPAYLVVRATSGIHKAADLRGHVVGVGPEGLASSMLGRLVAAAFGVDPSAVRVINTRSEAAASLKDRSVDAVFLPGYVYPDEAMYSAFREGAYLVPVEGPPVEHLRQEHPFIRATTIPRNVLPGQDRMVQTVGMDMMVVCRRDLDESVVYDVTKQLFIAFPRLSSVEASLRFLNFEEAAATPIPLHPGASRYFRERELSR
jgi:TRAP transporter TAXI family solute receptor